MKELMEMNLEEIRNQIDKIDDEITDLLKKRYSLARKVGELKKNSRQSVFIPKREQAIIERLIRKADENLSAGAIQAIYREIFSGSRFVENPISINFLLSDTAAVIAAYSIFGRSVLLKPQPDIAAIFSGIKNDINSYAVISSKSSPPPLIHTELISEIELDNLSEPNTMHKYRVYKGGHKIIDT